MSAEAPSELMRYGPMRDWLKEHKIPECEVKALIDKGVIKRRYLRKGARAWYNAVQIRRDVLSDSNGTDESGKQENRKTK